MGEVRKRRPRYGWHGHEQEQYYKFFPVGSTVAITGGAPYDGTQVLAKVLELDTPPASIAKLKDLVHLEVSRMVQLRLEARNLSQTGTGYSSYWQAWQLVRVYE